MLNGKAAARAIRGYMIVDTASHALLMSKIFKVDLNKLESKVQATIEHNEFKEMINQQKDLEDVSLDEMESRMCHQRNSLLDNAANIYDKLSNGEMSMEEACQNQILLETKKIFEEVIALRDNRSTQIWIQCSEMVQILRTFIKAKKTGDRNLHLQTMYDILPFFAAA